MARRAGLVGTSHAWKGWLLLPRHSGPLATAPPKGVWPITPLKLRPRIGKQPRSLAPEKVIPLTIPAETIADNCIPPV